MADFSETQGGGALANFLAQSLSGLGQEMYDFRIQMENTAGTAIGTAITAGIACQASGTEPGTLSVYVTASAFSGDVGYTLPVNAIRLFFSTSAAPTTFTDWLRIPLGSNYDMNNAGYTLDLTQFNITLDNLP